MDRTCLLSLYSNTKIRAYAAASRSQIQKGKKWGWHSRQQTGNLWNSLAKDTVGAESFHEFKGWMGQTLGVTTQKPHKWPQKSKAESSWQLWHCYEDKYDIYLPSSFNMWETGMGHRSRIWTDHSYIKLNQFTSHQWLETATTLENLFLLWRGLPVLPWGLSILQLICALLACKPEVYKGNMEAELQCHKQLAQEWFASLILCSSQTAVKSLRKKLTAIAIFFFF